MSQSSKTNALKKPSSNTQRRYSNRKVEDASSLVRNSLSRIRLDRKMQRYQEFPNWAEVVGERIASHAIPDRFLAEQTLVVKVKNSTWAQELSLQKQILLEKLRVGFPESVVSDIRFEVADLGTFKSVKS